MENENISYNEKEAEKKIGLHNHGNMLLRHIRIDEEIEEIDTFVFMGKNSKLTFRAKLKSGKILEVKCEREPVGKETLEKLLKNSKELHCQKRKEIITVIFALSKGENKDTLKCDDGLIFNPFLIEIGKFDSEKLLEEYKHKVKKRIPMDQEDCEIINLMPEMHFDRKISDVLEELCYIIKDGRNYNKYKRELITSINLSIDYHVIDEEKKEELKNILKKYDPLIPEYNRIIRDTKKEGKLNSIRKIRKIIFENPEMTMEELNKVLEQEEIRVMGW